MGQFTTDIDTNQVILLVVDDPDGVGGTVIHHWILFNILPTVNGLEQNIKQLPTGTRRGKNVSGSLDYVGPCPPDGKVHRYHFKLMTLDCILPLADGATIDEMDIAISRHVIGVPHSLKVFMSFRFYLSYLVSDGGII